MEHILHGVVLKQLQKKTTSNKTTAKKTTNTKSTTPAKNTTSTTSVPTKQSENEDVKTITTGIDTIGNVNVSPNLEGEGIEIYNNMSAEEKASTMGTVNKIVATVKTDSISQENQKIIDSMLHNNNITSKEDAKVCPISFDGHIDLGFPVKVTVDMANDQYNITDKIYVYHIREDGGIEDLGEAEKTIENGKVVAIIFETKGFSDFFSTTSKLNIEPKETIPENVEKPAIEEKRVSLDIPYYFIAYIVVSLTLIIAETITIIKLKKKMKSSNG